MKAYSSKSTDNGNTWLERKSISDNEAHWSQNPVIVIDDTLLQVFFADDRDDPGKNFEIYHSVSTDWGDNWSHPNDRITAADSNSWHPAVTCNGPSVHIVWGDNRGDPTNYEIYYNRSDDHCQHWVYGIRPGGLRLTSIAGRSDYPDIASYGNIIHVVWWDQRKFNPGIYYQRSTDNGNTWQAEVKLDADYGSYPAIAADERGVYVVWQQEDGEGYSHIYYRESTDQGATWGPITQITYTADFDKTPDIYADDLGRHVVFVRNKQIYYKQRDIKPPAPPQNLHEEDVPKPPVVIAWDANTEPDLHRYRIYRRTYPIGEWNMIAQIKTVYTSYTDHNVLGGTYYEYYVSAVDQVWNESDPSNHIIVYVPPADFSFNLGEKSQSPLCVVRDGYHAWGSSPDSTADYAREELKYSIVDLKPDYTYSVGFMLMEPESDTGRIVDITINDKELTRIAVPDTPMPWCYYIPESQSRMELSIKPLAGRDAVLSRIDLWVHRRGGGGPQGSGGDQGLPIKTGLISLYPTLVKDGFTIRYGLARYEVVLIDLYDSSGRRVRRIIRKEPSGYHRLSIKTGDLSSGIYFLRFKAADYQRTEKLVVVR